MPEPVDGLPRYSFRGGEAPDESMQRHFRGSLGRFATGVAVVTFDGAEARRGITVNSFTSVSLDPPLVLISIARQARAHADLLDRPFTVNIVSAQQQHVAMHFAGKEQIEIDWIEGEHAPRLPEVLSYFECTPWAAYDGGDHTLFVARVEHFGYREGDSLGFLGGRFTQISAAA
jgi:flavin reductase (DIM6/NTAB) family NADH-FMN oxidoreductase RutF